MKGGRTNTADLATGSIAGDHNIDIQLIRRSSDSTTDFRHAEPNRTSGNSGGYTIAAICTSGLRGKTCGEASRSRQ